MNGTDLALVGSGLLNVLFIWAWVEARYNAVHYRRDRDHWRDSALHWSKSFDDLRRNSIKRNPKTGRYMKDFTK